MNIKGSKKKNQVLSVNIFEQQEIIAKADAIKAELKASTWHELETKGKFDKNDKLSFVSDDMLILGCDIGSETHYVRAIDTRGRELSKLTFGFSNTVEGFESMLDWNTKLAAAIKNGYSRWQSWLWHIRKNLMNFMFTIRQGTKIR